MNLSIIRHAESFGNATGDYSVAESDSLSPKGERQAVAIVDGLASRQYDKVIVSPLTRAMQTVAPFLEATGQRAEIWPEIAEACWHDEREAEAACWRRAPASLHNGFAQLFSFRNGDAVRPAHPESFGEGLCRTRAAHDRIQRLAREEGHTHVLMVTHGHFIRELINLILNASAIVRYPHDNCGMSQLSFDGAWAMPFTNRQPSREITPRG